MSLLELAAVVAVIGVLAGMAVTRFGHDTLAVSRGEGFARKLALGMRLARRQAIAEGDNAALTFTRSGGAVTGWTIVRALDSGDEATEAEIDTPTDVTVVTSSDRWEFDYSGALTTPSGGGILRVDAPGWSWDLQVYVATGSVAVSRSATP